MSERTYVETYEGMWTDFPGPEGCYATCCECGWDGPHRDEHKDAERDCRRHERICRIVWPIRVRWIDSPLAYRLHRLRAGARETT